MTTESAPEKVEIASKKEGSLRTPWGRHALVSMLFFVLGAEMFVLSPLIPMMASEFGVTTPVAAMSVAAFALTYATTSPLVGAFRTA